MYRPILVNQPKGWRSAHISCLTNVPMQSMLFFRVCSAFTHIQYIQVHMVGWSHDEQFYFDALRHSERSGDRALCRSSLAPVYTTAPCLSTLLVYRADYGFSCDPGLRINGYRTAYE